MEQIIKHESKMRIIKPTQDEKTIIQILIATSFGLIIGVWAYEIPITIIKRLNRNLRIHFPNLLLIDVTFRLKGIDFIYSIINIIYIC